MGLNSMGQPAMGGACERGEAVCNFEVGGTGSVSVRANPSMKRGVLMLNWKGEQRGNRTTASAASTLCGSGSGGDGVRSERVEPGSVQQAARHTAQDAGTLRNALSEAEGGWQRTAALGGGRSSWTQSMWQ